MRALTSTLLAAGAAAALAGCNPDVEGGAYYCGADELCPPNLTCDGASNLCVAPGEAQAFTCTEGQPIGAIGCPTESRMTSGCVMTADGHDRWQLTAAAGCATKVVVQITYPDAFMPLAVTVRDAGDAAIATSAACNALHGGLLDACVSATLTAGQTYTIDVAGVPGASACGGHCAFNRYTASVQILPP